MWVCIRKEQGYLWESNGVRYHIVHSNIGACTNLPLQYWMYSGLTVVHC